MNRANPVIRVETFIEPLRPGRWRAGVDLVRANGMVGSVHELPPTRRPCGSVWEEFTSTGAADRATAKSKEHYELIHGLTTL